MKANLCPVSVVDLGWKTVSFTFLNGSRPLLCTEKESGAQEGPSGEENFLRLHETMDLSPGICSALNYFHEYSEEAMEKSP